MKKIILIGIPGCGKTTLGKLLAKKLKKPFYDTDQLMVSKLKLDRFSEFIAIAFNGQFVNVQKIIMNELAKREGSSVISTSAEVALISSCANLMKTMGTVIHIQRKPEIILATQDSNGFTRNDECLRLYMQEYNKYEEIADFSIENNGTENEGLEKLFSLIHSQSKITN